MVIEEEEKRTKNMFLLKKNQEFYCGMIRIQWTSNLKNSRLFSRDSPMAVLCTRTRDHSATPCTLLVSRHLADKRSIPLMQLCVAI